MTIVITGWRSQIAEEFRRLLPPNEVVIHGKPLEAPLPLTADRYFFCQGLLYPKSIDQQTDEETFTSYEVNFNSIKRECDAIFEANPIARVCVIGSESGYRGSFDESYAASKASLHIYVEQKELPFPCQQLVAISPGIIEDCRMTTSRTDVEGLSRRRADHPMKRFLKASEVARMARMLLYFQPYVSSTIVRMHGGQR